MKREEWQKFEEEARKYKESADLSQRDRNRIIMLLCELLDTLAEGPGNSG